MSDAPRPGRARRTARARARQRRARRPIYIAIGVVVSLALAIGAVLLFSRGGSAQIEGLQTFSGLSQDHVQTKVDYPQTPPVGGPHAPAWQNCGYYDVPIGSENGVHSLEHGAVWITYRPDLSQDQVEALRALTRSQTYVLVSPFPDLPAPLVASAWGRQAQLESVSDPRLDAFVRAFRQGPQTPEPGAVCTRGVGAPK